MTVRICICGGGAIAHTAAAVLGARPDMTVAVLTRSPDVWARRIVVHHGERYRLVGNVAVIDERPEHCVPDADLVMLAVPAFARGEVLARIAPHVRPEAWVGSLSGTGGFDWQAQAALGRETRVFAFQRAPWVARVVERGHLVAVTGVRSPLMLAGHPAAGVPALAARLAAVLGNEIAASDDYLVVTLGFDNPTLHPPRLRSLFGGASQPRAGERFYRDWDDEASEHLLALDGDLARVRASLGVTGAPTAREHFGIRTAPELTARIRSIRALADIAAPIDVSGALDRSARYPREDLSWGLEVQREVARLAGVEVPTMDAMIAWGRARFGLTDDAAVPLPQRHGITTREALLRRARE